MSCGKIEAWWAVRRGYLRDDFKIAALILK
jgi:hypothetical protein